MPDEANYPNNYATESLALPAAAGSTPGAAVHGTTPVGLICPAGLVSTALSVEGSMDGSNWYPVYDEIGAAVQVVVGASRLVGFGTQMSYLGSALYIRFTTASNEGAVRDLTLIMRPN